MNKHKLSTAVAIICLCLVCAFSALADSFGIVSNTCSLNLRAAASSSSQWLGSYAQGTWVQITGSQNNFYKVYIPEDGRSGYMSKNYINSVSGHSAWTLTVNNTRSNDFLNFRSQPSYSASVLGIFYNGVPLLAKGKNNGWYTVQINGQTGYVRQEFVRDHGNTRAGSSTVATIKTPNNTVLNMRSGPGYNYSVVGQFNGDRYVMVLQKAADWWYVSIDGYTGFMSQDFLQEGLHAARDEAVNPPPGPGPAPVPVPTSNAIVTASCLNVREYPTTASAIVTRLYNGTEVYVLSYGADWCQIMDPVSGYTGYAMSQFLQFGSPIYDTYRYVRHPNGSYVNLRSSADMYLNNVLVQVPSGSMVTVLSPGNVWSKVSYNGITGYMMTYFLQSY